MSTRETLLISDLHLSPQRPATVELFLRFLRERAPAAERLYILGDLFDAWIGDDDRSPPGPRVLAALNALASGGTQVFFQRGNRDFLVGRRFARESGCTLLPDPACADLYGRRSLLMHGDLLCSDDLAYQRFRRKARNPLIRNLFLLQPLGRRRRMAADYRRRSGEATALKSADIMDVNPETVVDYMRRFGVRLLIHGHTHRPAHHRLELDGEPAHRWVLAEWHAQRAQLLRCTAEGLHTEAFPAA
jgi:UDP-2,3-diacylglucosamine hydrolase